MKKLFICIGVLFLGMNGPVRAGEITKTGRDERRYILTSHLPFAIWCKRRMPLLTDLERGTILNKLNYRFK